MNKITFIKFISAIIFFVILSSCTDDTKDLYQKITFTQKASFPGGVRASSVGFSINGKGYVALGRKRSNATPVKEVWEYNPVTDNWLRKNDFPGTGRVKATCAVVDGKAYVGLGFDPDKGIFNSEAYLNDWWMYDPISDTWTQKATFYGFGRISNFSFVYDGNIYIGSGYDGLSFTNEFYSYNPLSNAWIKLSELPGDARSGPVACTDGERIFFGTGFDVFDINDWWEYLPDDDEWEKRKSMPDTGRENAVALTINNRFFVATGRNFGGEYTGGGVKSDILEYNPDQNKWYKRGNIPTGGRENAVSFVINNIAYIGLGENDTILMDDFWSFEP